MSAVRALKRGALADRPHARRGAPRARWLATPARLDPISAAVVLGREPRLELRRRLGKSRHKSLWFSRVMAPLLVGAHSARDCAGIKRIGMLQHRGIDLTKASLGSSNATLAIAYNSLAYFLDEQGRKDEAKVFLEKALEIAERTLGRDHYQALWSRVGLALREAEANPDLDIEPLIESARAAAESRMGTTHPLLIWAATRVGRTYNVQNLATSLSLPETCFRDRRGEG